MSILGDFMQAARQILDEQDAQRLAPHPFRPPVFVRTNYLFVEIDEALATATKLATQIKAARLENNPRRARELNKQIACVLRKAAQMAAWIEEQFRKDFGDVD